MSNEPLEPAPQTSPVPMETTSDDRSMAMLCHLGGILGFLIPLIVWLIKKDQSKFVDNQGKEALNFHLTMLIGHVIGGATICITFGLINLAVWVISLVFSIIGGMEANKGVRYRYPICIRFIT
jgi:uncharacterized Tic20 family protein